MKTKRTRGAARQIAVRLPAPLAEALARAVADERALHPGESIAEADVVRRLLAEALLPKPP